MSNSTDGPSADIADEQAYVSMLYGRIDALRGQTLQRIADLLREGGGTPQARSERDSGVSMYGEKLAQLNAVEAGLCFGRIDFDSADRLYIGRIGLFDEDGDFEPLLVDWRAPAARPFYLATAASPAGVRRRRHIRTRDRHVVSLDDEVLDLESAGTPAGASSGAYGGLTGEATLLAAMTSSRTGRMKDIVETIQVEQDRVIRSDLAGILVVSGGPGTGKTAVALHRAAYLLYTHRDLLSQRGVLMVGPNATFLRYISQVLPSLAETGVLLCTPGQLYPGVDAHAAESAAAAAVKGRLAMVDVLAAAIRDRQQIPDVGLEITFDNEPLRLDRDSCARARDVARRSSRPHNQARPIFEARILDALTNQVAQRVGADPYSDENFLNEADLADIRRELADEPAVHAALDWMWPILTPQRLLADLFSSPQRLAAAAADVMTRDEQALLVRRLGRPVWTVADVPLLDEAAELLGAVPVRDQQVHDATRRSRIEYAEGVLDIATGSRSVDTEDEEEPEILMVSDLMDADVLALRHEDTERLTVAQRAAADRTWAFGHIIVDEAQELSPMAWRVLMRRCPSRSMTVVGDVAQTSDLAGVTSWQDIFEPYVARRWRLAELTVNYRTPVEIMSMAGAVLATIDPSLPVPRSVRETGVRPAAIRVDQPDLAEQLTKLVRHRLSDDADGKLAVIVAHRDLDPLGAGLAAAVDDVAVGADGDLLSRVAVLTVAQAKGLEFDAVIVVEPTQIIAESPRGHHDLYVALTRATHRLSLLHTEDLPESLREWA